MDKLPKELVKRKEKLAGNHLRSSKAINEILLDGDTAANLAQASFVGFQEGFDVCYSEMLTIGYRLPKSKRSGEKK